ncbi:MAG: hypothetical protein ABIR67_09060 [Gaiellaceae bacterium]
MGNQKHSKETKKAIEAAGDDRVLPAPSTSYRRRSWVEFQRALDPLAPIKRPPPPKL